MVQPLASECTWVGLPPTCQGLGGRRISFTSSKSEDDPQIMGKPGNKVRVLE